MRRFHDIEWVHDQDTVLDSGTLGNYDLFIVSLDLTGYDGLRFCARLRSMEHTRQIPVLAIADPKDRQRILRGFDLGVNDYVSRPVDPGELAARTCTQVRRKHYADYLRQTVEASLEMAAADPLTGLHNRRYLEAHLGALLGQTRQDRLPAPRSLTSMTSNPSTIGMATAPEIRFCKLSPHAPKGLSAGPTSCAGSAATNSFLSCRDQPSYRIWDRRGDPRSDGKLDLGINAGKRRCSQSGLLRRADMALYRRNRMDAIEFRWIARGRPSRNGWQAACNLGKAAADINE